MDVYDKIVIEKQKKRKGADERIFT